ncbi:hypothetical protein ZWY2020_049363 [Hordeum vulgare]|nr:hypothetical protein ZWY2020_049363 [Hordeum vulgare]
MPFFLLFPPPSVLRESDRAARWRRRGGAEIVLGDRDCVAPPTCCSRPDRLRHKVSLLKHLVAEAAEAAGEDGAAEPEATAWVADLLRAPLRVEMGTRRPLVLQMVHDPTALDPRCRFQVRDALHLF